MSTTTIRDLLNTIDTYVGPCSSADEPHTNTKI